MVLEVEEENRIDKYVALETDYSRSTITKLIQDGIILVNGTCIKPSFKVKVGDTITINEEKIVTPTLKPENIPLDILYEDDDLMVINKPSSMVVHPGNGNYEHTLVNSLMYHTKNLSDIGGKERLGIVHRLDKDTSGLMLVAKNNETHGILSEWFKTKKIHREYIALIEGVFPHQKATIDAPIARDKDHFQRYTVSSTGKKAVTHLVVIKKYSKYTLVRLILETGRTHQIRVHLSYIGYPVYNDPVYSNKKCSSFGQFLHSTYLEFEHPRTHENLTFEIGVPKEFQEFLDKIEEDEKEDKVN